MRYLVTHCSSLFHERTVKNWSLRPPTLQKGWVIHSQFWHVWSSVTTLVTHPSTHTHAHTLVGPDSCQRSFYTWAATLPESEEAACQHGCEGRSKIYTPVVTRDMGTFQSSSNMLLLLCYWSFGLFLCTLNRYLVKQLSSVISLGCNRATVSLTLIVHRYLKYWSSVLFKINVPVED